MTDHALETYIWAVANEKNVRAEVRDFLEEQDSYVSEYVLDWYIARLKARSICKCKCPGFDVSNLKVCPTCKKLHRKDVTK